MTRLFTSVLIFASTLTSTAQTIFGCTDELAINYNPEATIDDGSCCYALYTISSDNPGEWFAHTYDGSVGQGNSEDQNQICDPNQCFTFSFTSNNGLMSFISIEDAEGNVVFSQSTLANGFLQVIINFNEITGCTDPSACNFNPNASCSDANQCSFSCYGCTDPNAINFEMDATIDNGKCCYSNWYTIQWEVPTSWYVLTLNGSETYNAFGTLESQGGFCADASTFIQLSILESSMDSTFYTISNQANLIVASGYALTDSIYTINFSGNEFLLGCQDSEACNYQPSANCQLSNSCDYSCLGCTDSSAPNFDPDASIDDLSCCASWISINLSESGNVYLFDSNFEVFDVVSYPSQNGFCPPSDCGSFSIQTTSGEPCTFEFTSIDGEILVQGTTNLSGYFNGNYSLFGLIVGCTNPEACNYSPEAMCDNGSCKMYCGGCTNETMFNYDPTAFFEDGSCSLFPNIPNTHFQTFSASNPAEYYVAVNLMSIEIDATLIIQSSLDDAPRLAKTDGRYIFGPYLCDQSVEFHLLHSKYNFKEIGNNLFVQGPCVGTISISDSGDDNENQLILFPNPSTGQFTIQGIADGNWQMNVTDITGRMVSSSLITINNAQYIANLGSLAVGNYQLTFSNNTQSITSRVAIQR